MNELIDYSWFLEPTLGSYKTVLVNRATWFVADSVNTETPKKCQSLYKGFVYAIEYGDVIKIGSTRNIRDRIQSISAHAKKYSNIRTGEFCFSEAHVEFRENERILHKAFSDKRIKSTELFHMTLEDFLRNQPAITMTEDDSTAREESINRLAPLFQAFSTAYGNGGGAE